MKLLVVTFHLEGCHSLKEKRRRLSRIKDRFGRQPNLGVCQSGYLDDHDRSEWSFVAIAKDARVVDQILCSLEERLEDEVDAFVADSYRENL